MSHTLIPNEKDYYGLAHEKKNFAAGEQKEALDFVVSHSGGGMRILEVGGGNGELMDVLPKSMEYWGIDPMEYAVKALQAKASDPARIAQGVAEELPFEDDFFDFIFSITVVEHVYDPRRALSEMIRTVKPGGYIIILCPNHETPWSTLMAVRHYSSAQKRTLLLRRWADLFKRMFGILTFRVIEENYTQATGKYERADDDLKYVASGYEIATFLKRHGCHEAYYRRFTGKKFSFKNRVKRLLTYLPIFRYWGGGVFLILKKTGDKTVQTPLPKRVLLGLTVSMFTLFVMGGVTEIGLRIYGVPTRIQQDRLNIYDFDEVYGWRTKKHSKQFDIVPGGESHYVYTNPEGFPVFEDDRDISYDTEAPSVALIGDSFVESRYVPYDKSFPHLLDKALGDRQVLNFGVRGYGPDQYLMMAREHLPQYNIQTIVVVFFPFNDTVDVSREEYNGYSRPYFGDQLVKPLNTPLKQLGGSPRDRNFIQGIADNSSVYTLLRPFIKRNNTVFNDHSVTEAQLTYDGDAMYKALRFIAQIKKEFPNKRFLTYYMPHFGELQRRDLYDRNTELFKKTANRLRLPWAVADRFWELDNPFDAFIIADGHLSTLGSKIVSDQLMELLQKE